MKKINILLVGSILVCLNSCNSNKVSSGDFYTDVDSVQLENKEQKNNDSGFSWAKAFGSNKFTIIDETTINTKTFTGDIETKTASITIFDKKKIAGFGSPYMLAYYYVSLDSSGRQYYGKAVDQYLKDFESKSLQRKGKDTYKKYGKINVRLDWGTIQSSTPNFGTTTANLGYEFKNNSPYFTITIYPTRNLREDQEDIDKIDSMKLTYYLTKAQATSLKNFLSDEYLAEYIDLSNNADHDEEKQIEPEKDLY